MKKDRLEWIASGLNRYVLTKAEDHFLRTALEDSAENRPITDLQEERLETLYKQKSRLIPNKTAAFVTGPSRKASPLKGRPKPFKR